MSQPQKKKDPFLKLIPKSKLSAQQKKLGQGRFDIDNVRVHAIYRFLQEPTKLHDVDWEKYGRIVIWRDNATAISVGDPYYVPSSLSHIDFNLIDNVGDEPLQHCLIYGESPAAVAETATFFWSLQRPAEAEESFLQIYDCCKFDFSSLSPAQLAQILDSNPSRRFDIQQGVWNENQTTVFATRPYPLDLRFCTSCTFEGDGTAFVSAIEKRQSPFGSLCLDFEQADDTPFSKANLTRLLKMDGMFESFRICLMKEELRWLPFTAKVNRLEYQIYAMHIEPDDFKSLEVTTKSLHLTLFIDWMGDWYGHVVSFFNRVAELGHFEKLGLSLKYLDCRAREISETDGGISAVAKALIGLIHGNPNLTYLDVSDILWCVDEEPHLPGIFEAIEDHPSLRTLMIEGCKPRGAVDNTDSTYSSDLDYDALEKLLSRNRNIVVRNFNSEIISNGPKIDKLYDLYFFLRASKKLLKESESSSRLQLVTIALVEGASQNFQHTGLLLSDHMDVLCELVNNVNLDEVAAAEMEETVALASVQVPTADRPKRRTREQPSRAAHKAARSEV